MQANLYVISFKVMICIIISFLHKCLELYDVLVSAYNLPMKWTYTLISIVLGLFLMQGFDLHSHSP